MQLTEVPAHSLVLDSAQEIDASAAKADVLKPVQAPSGLPPTLHLMYLATPGRLLSGIGQHGFDSLKQVVTKQIHTDCRSCRAQATTLRTLTPSPLRSPALGCRLRPL